MEIGGELAAVAENYYQISSYFTPKSMVSRML